MYWPVLMENFWRNPVLVQRSVTFAIRSSRTGTEGFLNELREAVWAVNANLPLARRSHAGGPVRALPGADLVHAGDAGNRRGDGAAARNRRHLRRDLLCRRRRGPARLGIRAALGAQHAELKRMFVRDGLVLAGIGVACGLAGAIPLTRLMTSLLFGISPLDPTDLCRRVARGGNGRSARELRSGASGDSSRSRGGPAYRVSGETRFDCSMVIAPSTLYGRPDLSPMHDEQPCRGCPLTVIGSLHAEK